MTQDHESGRELTRQNHGVEAPGEGSELTTLEHQALELIANGCDLVTTAKRLHVSEATVTRLLRSARDRLAANSTIQTVLFAAQRGLLERSDDIPSDRGNQTGAPAPMTNDPSQ